MARQAGAELCQAQYILGLAKQAVPKYPALNRCKISIDYKLLCSFISFKSKKISIVCPDQTLLELYALHLTVLNTKFKFN